MRFRSEDALSIFIFLSLLLLCWMRFVQDYVSMWDYRSGWYLRASHQRALTRRAFKLTECCWFCLSIHCKTHLEGAFGRIY